MPGFPPRFPGRVQYTPMPPPIAPRGARPSACRRASSRRVSHLMACPCGRSVASHALSRLRPATFTGGYLSNPGAFHWRPGDLIQSVRPRHQVFAPCAILGSGRRTRRRIWRGPTTNLTERNQNLPLFAEAFTSYSPCIRLRCPTAGPRHPRSSSPPASPPGRPACRRRTLRCPPGWPRTPRPASSNPRSPRQAGTSSAR